MKRPGGRWGISGKIMVLLIVLAAVAGPATVYLYLNLVPHVTNSITMSGTLIVNSSGQVVKDTTGASSAYNVSLSASHGSGTMNLTLLSSSHRDVVAKHADYVITNLVANDTVVSMRIDGKFVSMVFEPNNDTYDTGQFNGSFVAWWAPGASEKGVINPLYFAGAGSQFFIELRLTPVVPPLPTFMSIAMVRASG